MDKIQKLIAYIDIVENSQWIENAGDGYKVIRAIKALFTEETNPKYLEEHRLNLARLEQLVSK